MIRNTPICDRTHWPIRAAFADLIDGLQSTDDEEKLRLTRFKAICNKLREVYPGVAVHRVGSSSRGTCVRGHSDLDVFIMLPVGEVRRDGDWRSSSRVLIQLRNTLRDRFPTTPIERDGCAVVMKFRDITVDVVPSFFFKPRENGWPLYMMPDDEDWWLGADPKAHNSFITKANERTKQKIKRTAQLMKLWRHTRSNAVRISSFYIEMLLATSNVCLGPKSYSRCLRDLFAELHARQCGRVTDPIAISKPFRATYTERQRETALTSVRDARYHADLAIAAEDREDWKEALRQWSIVFNHQVPHFR